MMQVFGNENTVFFDVDDTLVMHRPGPQDIVGETGVSLNLYGETKHYYPNAEHITFLKASKARGFDCYVWSQYGYQWAHEVVKKLNLEPYVKAVLTKPRMYVDDLSAENWMAQVYLTKDRLK